METQWKVEYHTRTVEHRHESDKKDDSLPLLTILIKLLTPEFNTESRNDGNVFSRLHKIVHSDTR